MSAPAPRAHRNRWDHLPHSTAYQRANRWLAIRITAAIGSMTCAYVFALIALISLPAAIRSGSVIVIVSWVAQTFFQLVLLAVILVGQSVAGEAADARAARTYADVEEIKNGMAALAAGQAQLKAELRLMLASVHDGYAETIRAVTRGLGGEQA